MTHLAKQFEAKTSEREYIALVWGNVKEDAGTIEGNIARHVKDRMQMMVFADPELLGSSNYSLGDNRRAPSVTLLDPLFKHWGTILSDSDKLVRTVTEDGVKIAFAGAGSWKFGHNCKAIIPEVVDCRIGKGRVILIGDSDILDARLWQEQRTGNPAWIAIQIDRLTGK